MKKCVFVPLVIAFVMRNAKQDNHGPRSSHSRFLKTQNVLNASDLMFAKKDIPKTTKWCPQNPMSQRIFMFCYIINLSKL